MSTASGKSETTSGPQPPCGAVSATPLQHAGDALEVTVGNAPTPSAAGGEWSRQAWYVLRTPYFRADRVKAYLDEHGFATHLPKRKTVKLVKGKRRKVEEACIPNTVFVFATRSQADRLVRDTAELPTISYIYDHCRHLDDGKNPPLTIPRRQMENFIRLVGIDNDNIVDVTNNRIHYRLNDRVRITQGQFKGIEGRVAKIFGQTRVVVELEGLCLMATAYIPKAFLSPESDA